LTTGDYATLYWLAPKLQDTVEELVVEARKTIKLRIEKKLTDREFLNWYGLRAVRRQECVRLSAARSVLESYWRA
jgi:hypothetical protein